MRTAGSRRISRSSANGSTPGWSARFRQVVMTTYRSSLIKTSDGSRPGVVRAAYYAEEPRLLIGEALIHQLDVLRFLLGPLDVVAARELHTEPDLPGETVASLLLEVRDSAPLSCSRVVMSHPASPAPETQALRSALKRPTASTSRVRDSSVVMNDSRIELRGRYERDEPVDYAASYQHCFDAAIAHFVERLAIRRAVRHIARGQRGNPRAGRSGISPGRTRLAARKTVPKSP